VTSPYVSDTAETKYVDGKLARYAYRDIGRPESTPPLVLFQRYRGTLDHWDPAFLDVLASERRVVLFDSAGVGASTGTTPSTVKGIAEAGIDFVEAAGFTRIDALGWSLGGYVVQMVALERPDLVRRLLVTGSGPGGVPGTPERSERVRQIAASDVITDEDYLWLFFGLSDEGQQAGRESLARLAHRLSRSKATVTPEAWHNQLQAIARWTKGDGSAWARLDELEMPVLVANGAHDVMIDSSNSFAMAKRLKHATTVLYSDAGHGFHFQHPDEFGRVVLDFLR
jgi:pimeloyl-ACP methyl ester carboxylesterase